MAEPSSNANQKPPSCAQRLTPAERFDAAKKTLGSILGESPLGSALLEGIQHLENRVKQLEERAPLSGAPGAMSLCAECPFASLAKRLAEGTGSGAAAPQIAAAQPQLARLMLGDLSSEEAGELYKNGVIPGMAEELIKLGESVEALRARLRKAEMALELAFGGAGYERAHAVGDDSYNTTIRLLVDILRNDSPMGGTMHGFRTYSLRDIRQLVIERGPGAVKTLLQSFAFQPEAVAEALEMTMRWQYSPQEIAVRKAELDGYHQIEIPRIQGLAKKILDTAPWADFEAIARKAATEEVKREKPPKVPEGQH